MLGYVVADRIAVVMNVEEKANDFPGFVLPAGKWKLIGDNGGFDHLKGLKRKEGMSQVVGGKLLPLQLPAFGFKVWMKE
ncbi:MAG: hypothetical protein HC913_11475 [Microscillaceae bacterium]|nr:hypothetical protein [Microscillaceae bacterium]